MQGLHDFIAIGLPLAQDGQHTALQDTFEHLGWNQGSSLLPATLYRKV